jgi:hypothetical protein
VTLETRSKLSLNRNNNAYFQNYIVPLSDLPVRGFKGSEHSLRRAFEWYEKHLRDWIKQDQSDAGVAIATFIESMCDRLFFTVITVNDELNAYKVFETLNARGVRLSSTDLLKNYLFSVLHKDAPHPHEMQRLEDRWEAIVTRLGGESFTEFVRSHWNSRYSFVRTPNLFRTIKSTITSRGKVFEFLRDMDADLDNYLAITNPEAAAALTPDLRRLLLQLKMFRVRQPYPLLLAAWRVLELDQFKALLNACVVAVFRYNVIANLPTNEQEGVYHIAAQKLLEVKSPSAIDGIRALAPIYPSDDSFKAYFSEKIVKTTDSRNNKVMRYILTKLEYQHSERSADMDELNVTIEHVLPQSPKEGWEQFSEEDLEAMTYRIGNMTLLERPLNKEIENFSYSAKHSVFDDESIWVDTKISKR